MNINTIHISPEGDDRGEGTREQPFATLDRARKAAREIRKTESSSTIHIECGGGYYCFDDTVVFGISDTASAKAPTIIECSAGETAIFGSGVAVRGWKRVAESDFPSEVPKDAAGKLFAAEYPKGIEHILALFDGETRFRRGRGAGFAIPVTRDEVTTMHPRDLHFRSGGLQAYGNLQSVELEIIPMYPWTMCILGIESIDLKARVARLDNDPVYPLAETQHGIVDQVWPVNVFEGLTAAWTWVSDDQSRTVYLRTDGTPPPAAIRIPKLRELVRIEGEIRPNAEPDVPIRGIEFRGITFCHGDRDTVDQNFAGTGLQHNWEFFDRPNAMVRFRGAEECALRSCRLVATASGGVRLDLHCRRNTVESCEIGRIGGTGVLLQGYGPGTKDVNRENRIVDNHIHHNGEDWWHNLGVFVWQSSNNLIANNTIHHTGYSGICVTGRIIFDRSGVREASKSIRWNEIKVDTDMGDTPESVTEWWYRMEKYLHARNNKIEGNEIYRAMERLGDGNAIYVSGCGGGNIVRKNYIHDIFGPGANAMIRTDDLQYETVIEQNLVFRCGGPGVYLKHKNDFINNILVDLGIEDPEGIYEGKPMFTGYIGLRRAPIRGSKVQRNILISTSGDEAILWEGKIGIASWGSSYLRECEADYNLYFSPSNATWATTYLSEKQTEGVEEHSIQADPRIADAGERSFTINPESPVVSLGFQTFSLRDVGSSLCGED
jgi:hypothetical protein